MIGRIGGKGDEGRRSVWRAGIAGFLSPVVLLLPLIGGALWLRWLYVVRVGLHVDEFSSLWAVRRVLDFGVPLLPSGVVYTRGLFHTYLTALFAQIGGFSFHRGPAAESALCAGDGGADLSRRLEAAGGQASACWRRWGWRCCRKRSRRAGARASTRR
jgi:hypothetical protein